MSVVLVVAGGDNDVAFRFPDGGMFMQSDVLPAVVVGDDVLLLVLMW